MPAITMMTVEVTINKKAIRIKTNDLFTLSYVDYKEVFIPLTSIRSIIAEDESNGINIIFVDSMKYTLRFEHFTSVGAKLIGIDITNNEELLNALIELAEF